MSEPQQELLDELARLRGLGEAYYDHRGVLRYFSPAARRAILQAMGLPIDDEAALRVALNVATSFFADETSDGAKPVCYQPSVLNAEKCWGISIQLYTLRSTRNWGMGDFGDLRELIAHAAPLGCDVIGLNPLHALFPADPQQCGPYSPSSRLFLNIFYIAVDAVPEFASCTSIQAEWSQASFQLALDNLRTGDCVKYQQVAELKLRALHLLHDHFRDTQLDFDSLRAQSFRDFVTRGGEPLRLHAIFDTLDKHCRQHDLRGWQRWPEKYQNPHSQTVQDFAVEHEHEVEFFMYAQWLADEQLAACQQFARDNHMRIGLYGDLAVGANPDGSEVWSNQALYVRDAAVGAPPDPLALNGQDWGVPPQDPHALRKQHYRPFIAMLHANMQHAGALRIDHVMSLFRLWWVPRGFSAAEGVYVHYPLNGLVGQLADVSNQAHCLVIGEDLGTVPDEVRHAMEQSELYHYKVLLFEKHGDGRFKSPSEYPRHAVATATTHDMAPLKSWWQGEDLTLRDHLGLYPNADTARQLREERTTDCHALLSALTSVALWQWEPHEPLPQFSRALARAMHLYLGKGQAALVLVQLEDLIGMTDPVNVPGTHFEHANWQRKLAADTRDIFTREDVCESLRALSKARNPNPNGT